MTSLRDYARRSSDCKHHITDKLNKLASDGVRLRHDRSKLKAKCKKLLAKTEKQKATSNMGQAADAMDGLGVGDTDMMDREKVG
jgi:hypothetical protein